MALQQMQYRWQDAKQYPFLCTTAKLFAAAVSYRCDYQSSDVQLAIDALVRDVVPNPEDGDRAVYLATAARFSRMRLTEHLLHHSDVVGLATERTCDDWLRILSQSPQRFS